MANKISRRWCDTCKKHVKAETVGASHLLHLVLSIVTFGVWLIVWFLIATNRKAKCTVCGSKVYLFTRYERDRWIMRGIGAFILLVIVAMFFRNEPPPPTSMAAMPATPITYKIAVNAANVRLGPGVGFDILGTAKRGERYVSAGNPENGWIQFAFSADDQEQPVFGWIRLNLLRLVSTDSP